MEPIVIIGAGMAGYGLLRELRKLNRNVPVTVITADDGAAYAKPNLSNALSSNKTAESLVAQTAAQVSALQNATVTTHTRVTHIDAAAHVVQTDHGSVSYSKLVLALGADLFAHGVQGEAALQILSVNDLADYREFRTQLEGKRSVTILGGGLIGCEFANDLIAAGYAVQVVHLGAHPLERLLPSEIAQALETALAGQGVRWHFGRRAVLAEMQDNAIALTLDDGSVVVSDVVLSAIGLRPRAALAAAAGIATARGVVVDRWLRTNQPDVYAIGDCAEVEGMSLPFVQPLLQQARALAATLHGTDTQVNYPAMPVVVKTSALPITVATPQQAQASWRVDTLAQCLVGHCEDAEGNLLGFAVAGQSPELRQSLTKRLPALLPAS